MRPDGTLSAADRTKTAERYIAARRLEKRCFDHVRAGAKKGLNDGKGAMQPVE